MDTLLGLLFVVLVALGGQQVGGVATWYSTEKHAGHPLFCDFAFPDVELRYDRATAGFVGPWVALDVGMYERGDVVCGQEVTAIFSDGTLLRAKALDAGRFDGYWTVDFGPSVPVVVDVPEYWRSHNDRVIIFLQGRARASDS